MDLSILYRQDLKGLIETPSLTTNVVNFVLETFDNIGLQGQLARGITIPYCNALFLPFYASNLNMPIEIEKILTSEAVGLAPGGKNVSLSLAIFGAMGEALERALAVLHSQRLRVYGLKSGDIIFGAYKELSKEYNLIGPDEIQFFHPRQFEDPYMPYEQFTDDTKISWVRGYRLLRGEEVYFPAQYACLGYRGIFDEKPIAYSTSSGLAASPDFHQSIYKGILETIERDIALLYWVSMTPPMVVNAPKDLLLGLLDDFDYLLNNRGFELKLYYFMGDIPGIHTVMAVIISKKFKYFKYVSGICADISLIEAIKGAMLEAFQAQVLVYFIHTVLKVFGRHSTYYYVEKDASSRQITNIFQSMFYWGYPENLSKLCSTFLASEKSIKIEDLEEESLVSEHATIKTKLAKLLDILRTNNIDPIVINQTPKEVSEKAYVLRIIIPELVFHYSSSMPFFGHRRYQIAPKILRGEERQLKFDEYNTLPLPFP
ncbi:MAG: YcaO-like family protein [Crenarchaeota archaeon]|nr:YcaO-like family protein [Thermoproteota archaeon]